jgi:aminoglycoside phosphotransferase (APT) family kinase protein
MTRIGWSDLPAAVRDGVEDLLADRVVDAASQPGGFSPGSADRVRTADGRRAFVKAAGSLPNPHSPMLHRREARISAALPPSVAAPALLGHYDDGDWVALVLEDVDGQHPVTPWRPGELHAVLATLGALARQLTPAPITDVPLAADELAADFAGWERLAADPPDKLDPWARGHLDELAGAARRGVAGLSGDTLVHADIRADNLLIAADGQVTVVDWPWACRGPQWLDTLLLLVNVNFHGGHDPEGLVRDLPATADLDPRIVTGVLAGLTAFFLDTARRPEPPGLPTLRAFQADQGRATLTWLRRRMDHA